MKEKTEFAEILEKNGLKLAEFCRFWSVPYRTAQDWKLGNRRTPGWVFKAVRIYIFLKERNLLKLFQEEK